MACSLAVKRHYDFNDSPINDAEVNIKRFKPTMLGSTCSSYILKCDKVVENQHSLYRQNSRADYSFEVKLPSGNVNCEEKNFEPSTKNLGDELVLKAAITARVTEICNYKSQYDSVFDGVSEKVQLTDEQLESYLLAQLRYLRRRRLIARKIYDNNSSTVNTMSSSPILSSNNSYRLPDSPIGSVSSDSDGELFGAHGATSGKFTPFLRISDEFRNKYQFTYNEVMMICQRLLMHQQAKLHYEYENIIVENLQRKHDEYVELAQSTISEQHEIPSDVLSYVS